MTSTESVAARKKGLPRWAGIIVAILLVGAGGIKLLGAATLPGCDSHDAVQSLREIFKETTGETVEVTESKLVSEGSGERNCSAHITTTTETADITYRVFWEGWSKKVQVGEVKAQPISGAVPQG